MLIYLVLVTFTGFAETSLCPDNSVLFDLNECLWITQGKYKSGYGQQECRENGGKLSDDIAFLMDYFDNTTRKIETGGVWTGIMKIGSVFYDLSGLQLDDSKIPLTDDIPPDEKLCLALNSNLTIDLANCNETRKTSCYRQLEMCPFGSLYNAEKSLCYWITNTNGNANESEDMCRSNNGTLAVFNDTGEYDILTTFYDDELRKAIGDTGFRSIYIAGRYTGNAERTYITSDGTVLHWFNWDINEPNHAANSNCTFIRESQFNTKLVWSSLSCHFRVKALCYRKLVSLDDELDEGTSQIAVTSSSEQPTEQTLTSREITSTLFTEETSTIEVSVNITSFSNINSQYFTTENMYELSSSSSCECCEDVTRGLNERFQSSFESIIEEMKIDKRQTSSRKRKLTSAWDNRPSSIFIGGVAIIILCLVAGVVILNDVPRLVEFIRQFKRVREKTRKNSFCS